LTLSIQSLRSFTQLDEQQPALSRLKEDGHSRPTRESTIKGVYTMQLDIRPFNEESTDQSITSDSRTNTFMDDLRARVAANDEKQRQKWTKAVKPAAARKPLTPARPDWLNAPKPAQTASKQPATPPRSRPPGSPKKKRSE
jgi:hypothetical protein